MRERGDTGVIEREVERQGARVGRESGVNLGEVGQERG